MNKLPVLSQLSAINKILKKDIDKDGYVDIIVSGNMFNSEVETPRNDGSVGVFLKFEPEKGFRLATYAMWWIKAAIQEYILRSWSLVKIGTTAGQKKLFFNFNDARAMSEFAVKGTSIAIPLVLYAFSQM